MVWIEFGVCLLIILFSARRVAIYGDMIAEKTGLGRIWIGAILLAIVTSLPEVFNGISSVTIVREPDLTIGNLFGANAFNLVNLALLNIIFNNRIILKVSPSQRRTAWFSMVLVLLAAISVVSYQFIPLALGWIGWYTPLIIFLYFLLIRRIRDRKAEPPRDAPIYTKTSVRRAYMSFFVAAALTVGASLWLAIIGEQIAQTTGWGETFVGTLFLSFATTLPEFSVSLSALQFGAVDLAVANVLGSSLFNMTIIGLDDILYTRGPILASVSYTHLIAAGTVLLMTLVLIAGIRRKPGGFSGLNWYSLISIGLFVTGAYLTFLLS